MDNTLKQRLVGAVVLVALGVIFIPALLDGSGYRARQARTIEIPEKPVFPAVSEVTVKPIATPIDKKKQEVEDRKQQEPEKLIQSWALQAGTFDKQTNATAFRDKLRKSGYPAYVETSKSDGKTSYRVRIGPELDRARLDKLEARLKKEQKIDGYIVRHP